MPIQAPQWTDYLSCPVCCREFGAPPRSPVSLSCGHTLCKHCLTHLHRRQCPFDQTVIQADPDELVVNTALLQLVGYPTPAQPPHPPCVLALSEPERRAYDVIVRRLEELATYLKYCGNAANTTGGGRLSRPMQRKLVTLVQCAVTDEEGRGRAARAARSLGERTVTELILQQQNPQQLSANLWAAVRARGCQFLGPAMQEEVLKLVLLALEDGSALSRKVLVMFVVQRLEPHFPQASKTSIGHVVQLLYRASCFKVSKRQSDSSLMQLKEEFRTYESLRREHDAQIVQIATEAGLRIAPDQWSALLYGDTAHKSHMQSIIDKLQTPQSFAQSVQELFVALQRTGEPAQLVVMNMHLDRLATIDASPDAKSPGWQQLADVLTSLREVVAALIHYLQQSARDANHNAHDRDAHLTSQPSPSTPTHKYKVSMCRDRSFCPRGAACTFAHSEDELERYRTQHSLNSLGVGNGMFTFHPDAMVSIAAPPQPTPVFSYHMTGTPHLNNYLPVMPLPSIPTPVPNAEFQENIQNIQNSNFQNQTVLNGQIINGLGVNQNGLVPIIERPFDASGAQNIAFNNMPYYGMMVPPSPGLPSQYQGFRAPSMQPSFPPPMQSISQSMISPTITGPIVASHTIVNQSVPPLPQVPVVQRPPMQNLFVPIGAEMNMPSGDLSPYPFDELQSDLFSDTYRAVAGRLGQSPPWAGARYPAWPRDGGVFAFDPLAAALPTLAGDDLFGVGSANVSANTNNPDDELEEEIQALERRLDKELDK